MYLYMKKLIEAKYYNTKEEAVQKLDVFYAMNKLADEQYIELTMLAEEKYFVPPVVEEPAIEETPVVG